MPTSGRMAEIGVRQTLMKQRFTLMLTALLMSVLFTTSAYGIEVDGIYYELNEETKEATVVAGGNKYEGDIVIPETITVDDNEYAVTTIGYEAFRKCSSLTSVIIPNSVTTIGHSAFDACI